MFCTECGKPSPESARFCRSCGAATGSIGTSDALVDSKPIATHVRANLRWAVIRSKVEYRNLTELQKFDMWFDMGYTFVSAAAFLLILAACVLEISGVIAVDGGSSGVVFGWLMLYGLFQSAFWLYVLPTKLAIRRARPNRMAIFALDFLLGWTLVGWAVSLSWALTSKDAAR
jgi:hypothetical protein